jgi:hypothetical protein
MMLEPHTPDHWLWFTRLLMLLFIAGLLWLALTVPLEDDDE